MGVGGSANYPRVNLAGNTRIVANAIVYFTPSVTVIQSDWLINSGGEIRFIGTGTLVGSLHVKEDGKFQSNNPFRTSGNTSILVEEGASWEQIGSAGSVELGIWDVVGTTTVTNWGRVYNSSSGGNTFDIGSRGNNANTKTYWWQMGGSSLEYNRSTLQLSVGYANFYTSPGEAIFYLDGGSVTNKAQLGIGISEHEHVSTLRSANGLINLWGGNWENEGPRVVIGGFKPAKGILPAEGHRTQLRGALVQTNGTFRSLGDVLVANGPSQGKLELSGGTFTATNATQNAKLVIGAAQFDTISPAPGDGLLDVAGGRLRVDRLVATNGSARSRIRFHGGTLETAGTEVDNGAALVVGDGTSAAVLNLLGGTHTFADGLTVNTNATLGIGATDAIASATINGALVLGTGSRLAWTFEDGDQDLATVTGTVTLPASATVELTPLDDSQPASIPLITATGGFAGTPSGWSPVSVNGVEYHAVIEGNTLTMQVPRGTLILLR